MIGLVVVTHGRLAEEFIAAAEHVVGHLDNARAISIGPDDDMDMRRKEIIAAVLSALAAEDAAEIARLIPILIANEAALNQMPLVQPT